MPIQRLCRDNVVNGENDFDSPFTFSVFGMSDHSNHGLNVRHRDHDWLWSDDNQFVAICEHMGGDYRANYARPRYFKTGDSLAETGFVDWMVGWTCSEGPDAGTVDRINEECGIGYHQNPTCALEDILDDDSVEWDNGVATTKNGYKLHPHYMGGDIYGSHVLTMHNLDNSIYDVSIDRDLWIDAVLKAGDSEEITETVETFCDVIVGSVPEWDDSEDLNGVFETIYLIDECYGEGASKAIAEELETTDTQQDVVALHKMLVDFIDGVNAAGVVVESDDVYEFMTNAGV